MKSTVKVLEKHTFGKSPACEYLVKLINESADPKRYARLHVQHKELRFFLKELQNAFDFKQLSITTVINILMMKRRELNQRLKSIKQEIILSRTPKGGETINIAEELRIQSVFNNVMVGEVKKLLREVDFYNRSQKSSISKARAIVRKEKSQNDSQVIDVQGTTIFSDYVAEVHMSPNHEPQAYIINSFNDKINDETLHQKSQKRQQRRKEKGLELLKTSK